MCPPQLECSCVSPFLDLLKQIAAGVIIHEPFQRTSRELMDFQDTVHRLQEMERLGLVGHVFTQVRSIAGQEFYDLAMVQGGLTEEGRRLLAEQQDKCPES